MTLPPKVKTERIQSQRWKSPGHRKWVAEHACCVPGCNGRPIEAHHVRTAANSGKSLKPGDEHCISLCRDHHREIHNTGCDTFGLKYKFDLATMAAEFRDKSRYWRQSAYGRAA